MHDFDFDIKLFPQVIRQLISAVNRAVLSAGTTESDGEMAEIAFLIRFDNLSDDHAHMRKKGLDFFLLFQPADDIGIETGLARELHQPTGIWQRPAIENKATAVSRIIHRNSTLE
jgi:hypothetical protein